MEMCWWRHRWRETERGGAEQGRIDSTPDLVRNTVNRERKEKETGKTD